METNRVVATVTAVIVVVAVLLVVVPRPGRGRAAPLAAPVADAHVAPGPVDRTHPPTVDGAPVELLEPDRRPPAPAQWAAGGGPIPSNSWWSSAVTGPGATSLWPQPLALDISPTGRVGVAAPVPTRRADGTSEAALDPAVFLDLGAPATTRVVGHGPLHATLRVARTATGPGAGPVDLTMVQGSPLVELTASDPLQLLVPGLAATTRTGSVGWTRLETPQGPWILASADTVAITRAGDVLTLTPGTTGRLVIGPWPTGADPGYAALAVDVAAHRLVATAERIDVSPDGTTTQVLTQTRSGGSHRTLWALLPAHQRYAVRPGRTVGTVPSAKGNLPVVAGEGLRLVFPAVPVLWSAVPLPGAPAPSAPAGPLPVESTGSYFGGKLAYAQAALGDALRVGGDERSAAPAIAAAARLLAGLSSERGPSRLRWDPTWGSVVIDPAEFGSDTELNDHQLQYGYWVAAASVVADGDPAAAARLRDTIDLLVADYAGAATVPGAASSLPAERTWSPYEGHSWASGTAPFGAGNDLESISESSFAWWAAARWFTSTGRSAAAATFIGRFTIETAMTGEEWLPQGAALPSSPAQRPWTGVVWSGKTDLATWFDPSPESALGIRLLPLGPASLARYGSAASLDAARARWAWCDRFGHGCTGRWANLLDSDAVVAGRPQLTGPDPEPSTLAAVSDWWRAVWEAGGPAPGWRCSIGAVARLAPDGTVTVLASNPAPAPRRLTCHDPQGALRWSAIVERTATAVLAPGPG